MYLSFKITFLQGTSQTNTGWRQNSKLENSEQMDVSSFYLQRIALDK